MDNNPSPFRMRVHLSVLKQLGINLYGNTPSVIAETIANAWDADAADVWVDTTQAGQITIEDNGHGMDTDDINDRYLVVGYQRREQQNAKTPKFKRSPMGRKGIGKLSLFSIANVVEVHSQKEGAKPCAFSMSVKGIGQSIKDNKNDGEYHPPSIPPQLSSAQAHGTRIILKQLKKDYKPKALQRALARRFSVLGQGFQVHWNNEVLSAANRGYERKMQYVWQFGNDQAQPTKLFKNALETFQINGQIEGRTERIIGWIGTVDKPQALKLEEKENLNKISIMVRGKMAKEDVLDILKGVHYVDSYYIGEIHANFLDEDEQDDIATTDRQGFAEEDERYQDLLSYLRKQLIEIHKKWSDLRAALGPQNMMQTNPVLKDWYGGLKGDARKTATRLIGNIHKLSLDDEAKKEQYKHAAIVVETSRHRGKLKMLDDVAAEDIQRLNEVFQEVDELEAGIYYQIVSGRLKVIKKLGDLTDENALEKILQKHIFDHLWLLDPSWERAAGSEHMEMTINRAFGDMTNAHPSRDRVDIKYTTTAGKQVIVELKRAGVTVSDEDIMKQLRQYMEKARSILTTSGSVSPSIEGLAVLGKMPQGWDDTSTREQGIQALRAKQMRVITYSELIRTALASYDAFLRENRAASKLRDLLETIEAS